MDAISKLCALVDWRLVVTLGLPAMVAVVGWFYVHKLNAQRDLVIRKREARLKALEAAYMRISTSMNRPLDDKVVDAIETFVAEIQLYGTPRQIELMQVMVEEFKKPNFVVSYDALLADMRDTIRSELQMEQLNGPVWWLRLTKAPVEHAANDALKPTAPPSGGSAA